MSGTSGNDSIENWYGSNVTIRSGAGNDSITNYGENVTINAGAGNDYIFNSYDGNYTTIDGGAGNDSIESYGNNVTITAGASNDLVSLESYYAKNNLIQYAEGDGNDTIRGFNADDTLQITKGSYTTSKSGTDFIVKVGESSITFSGDGSAKINIQDSLGNVITYNEWTVWNGSIENNIKSNVTLAGSKNADTIGNSADNVLITGQAGNDSIKNYSSNVTISGGAGHDYVYNNGDTVKVYGGEGNDSVESSGANVTIKGGAGNDSVSLKSWASNNVIQYAKGDGNDKIVGFNKDDTLQITSGEYSAKLSGKDVIVTVGTGKITLKNAKGKNISIMDSDGNVTKKKYTSSSSALFAEDNLSEIVAEKSVAEFENTAEKVTQENLITFAE